MKKRKYTPEFKRDAVLRVVNGESPGQICRHLKIGHSMLYNWRRKFGSAAVQVVIKDQDKKFGVERPEQLVKDAIVYIRHALKRWPPQKKREIHQLYVELALATLEGRS